MSASRYHNRLSIFLAAAMGWGVVSLVLAEQPPVVAPPAAQSKTATPPRVKPQVIYHLPPASAYAAALHSQAKTQRDVLPADNTMPSSPQISRGPANEAAAKPQLESSTPRSNAKPPQAMSRPAPKPRAQTPRPVVRDHSAGKGHGPGKSHGNKSHRK